MDKAYEHKKYESDIYRLWEENHAFDAKVDKNKKPFTIIMPPPNANDPLHVGHAMFITVEDILIRFHRMRGDCALWLPGTDHAGIETQYVFEKKLAKEGKSRFQFDRENLYKMIWNYVQTNSGVAVDQMKKLGASADWSRFKFTLDPEIIDFVLDTFLKLNQDGLIYRGERLVNYCTKCGTGYSELEVEYVERPDPLYYMKYGPFEIATTRPETKFRDSAVAANPKDKRYAKYLGKQIEVTGLLGPVMMTVIPDPEVDPKFGTGIMKVTPAHDPHDFELGQKFNLPVTPIITAEGRMDFSWYLNQKNFEKLPEIFRLRANRYHGLKVAEMRKVMMEDLKKDELLINVDENYIHRVGTCYRCHNVLEPIPLPQFFIKTKPLAQAALNALSKKETKIMGAGRDKILKHWLTNIKDWNISRQIVWGTRIPVWYSIKDNPDLTVTIIKTDSQIETGKVSEVSKKYLLEEIKSSLQKLTANKDAKFIVSKESPGEDFIQETDTFDTWFSSGQWPVVTLKTNKPGDFEYFYPTSVMETGYDILPIWVMRMMLLGIYLTGKSPFHSVYLHGLVRDEQGRKMSKSVGNVINPLDLVEKFGADALRMALVMNATPGNDSNVGENKVRGMRNLSNKIWNAVRFTTLNIQEAKAVQDQVFRKKLYEIVSDVTKNLNELKAGQAAEIVYAAFWHWFCDSCIERAKQGDLSWSSINEGLSVFLKLLHPFMPFVTEVVWQEGRKAGIKEFDSPTLISADWPRIS